MKREKLSLSIFSPQEVWHDTINEGILPAIQAVSSEYDIQYEIKFNYVRGENLVLNIYTGEDNCLIVGKKINSVIQNYINSIAVGENPQILDPKLFKYFPKFCLKYNLHNESFCYRYDSYQLIDGTQHLSSKLTEHLIEGLADGPIDDENIKTFLLYLHFAIITEFEKDVETLDQIYPKESFDEEHSVKFYQKNQELINQIYEEVNTVNSQWAFALIDLIRNISDFIIDKNGFVKSFAELDGDRKIYVINVLTSLLHFQVSPSEIVKKDVYFILGKFRSKLISSK